METYRLLNLMAIVASIMSFALIGLRSEATILKEGFNALKKNRSLSTIAYFVYLVFPYLFFILVMAVFAMQYVFAINVRYHAIKWISADVHPHITPIDMKGLSVVEFPEANEHFKITVAGVFFGPELRKIRERFGSLSIIKVFAVVSERARPATEGLLWVQGNECGTIDDGGTYIVKAYLGGIGFDRATSGDSFTLRLYVPKNPDKAFPTPSTFKGVDKLPDSLFISDPIWIKIK